MRIAEVIGRVTLSRAHPSLRGARFVLALPYKQVWTLKGYTRGELLALPGIGPYAAGAVMSIGFGIPSAMVDGPTGRLLRRLGGIRDNGRAPYYDKRVWSFAERLLPASGAREFQLALLDVAALLCRPGEPLCSACPLENICSYARHRD